MTTRMLRRNHVSLFALSVAAFAVGCGGKSTSDTPDRLSWRTYTCQGFVQGPGLATPVVLGTPLEPPLLCSPNNKPADEKLAECQTACEDRLNDYATALMLPADQADDLTCTISRVDAAGANTPDCDSKSGPEMFQGDELLLSSDTHYLQGGFSQYRADVSGNFHVLVHVPVGANPTADAGISGHLNYYVSPPGGPCPASGCEISFSTVAFSVGSFLIAPDVGANTRVENLDIRNDDILVGTINDAGDFSVGEGSLTINLDKNQAHGSEMSGVPGTITGNINRTTGVVDVDTLNFSEEDTDFTISSVDGTNVASPPVVTITPPTSPVECNATNGANASYSATATDPEGHTVNTFFWQIGQQSAGQGASASGFFPLGDSQLRVVAFDSTLAGGGNVETVTVVDTTKPKFARKLPDLMATLCDPNGEPTSIPNPSVSDICDASLTITGEIIKTNGRLLAAPLPIVNALVQLSVGSHIVRWRATDDSGNFSIDYQKVQVRPAIYATHGVDIGKEATVRVNDTVLAAIGNSGHEPLSIGDKARAGDLFSKGKVLLGHHSFIDGDIFTSDRVLRERGAFVTGTVREHVHVPLPPPLDLDGVRFPDHHRPGVRVRANRTLEPGSYAFIEVERHATLRLGQGVYFTDLLKLERGSRLELDQTAPGTRIFVSNHIQYEGDVVTIAGNPQDFVLGFDGHAEVAVKAPFAGTLVAPDALAFVRTEHDGYVGRLFARHIKLKDRETLTCSSPNVAVVDGLGSGERHHHGSHGRHDHDGRGHGDDHHDHFHASDIPDSEPGTTHGAEAGCSIGEGSPKGGAPWAGLAAAVAGLLLMRRRRAGSRRTG